MSAQHQFNPSDLSTEQLDRIVFAIAAKLIPLIDKGDEVLTPDEAAACVKYKRSTFDTAVSHGIFKAHRITPKSDPKFLKSELLEVIKRA